MKKEIRLSREDLINESITFSEVKVTSFKNLTYGDSLKAEKIVFVDHNKTSKVLKDRNL